MLARLTREVKGVAHADEVRRYRTENRRSDGNENSPLGCGRNHLARAPRVVLAQDDDQHVAIRDGSKEGHPEAGDGGNNDDGGNIDSQHGKTDRGFHQILLCGLFEPKITESCSERQNTSTQRLGEFCRPESSLLATTLLKCHLQQ